MFGTFRHQVEGDHGPNGTWWVLRRLTLGDVIAMEGGMGEEVGRLGTQNVEALRRGLVAWENFLGVRRTRRGRIKQEIAFSVSAIDYIPWDIRHELVNEIIKESYVTDKLEVEIRNAVRSAHLRTKAKSENTWDCNHCSLNPKLQKARNCSIEDVSGKVMTPQIIDPKLKKYLKRWDYDNFEKGKMSRWLTFGGHQYEKCPIGLAKPRAFRLIRLIMDCENKNVLPVHPPVWTEQPYFYCQAVYIVTEERGKIEHAKRHGQSITPTEISKNRPKTGRELEDGLRKQSAEREAAIYDRDDALAKRTKYALGKKEPVVHPAWVQEE